ncbi:sensor histidine kinase [Alkalibacter saccharofermentans]|uniref:GHKL domain-containing protein n=1 Tax=Alkalibacter saccharofermentans DSM 14828 TaxID=1120975 RepID=A0A1M4ZZP9_9FIRM|nr:ATP-binding protein [Alkalibacter saccharofermentans]SHF23192.1 GHKL domain-containing protein [Alkalibacter saccharofermentans DSM 14828]
MYYILVFLSFLQSVIGFTLLSSSVMKFREPVKTRIAAGFIVMFFGISLLSYTLYRWGPDSINRVAILVILAIQLSWYLISSKDRFFVSLFSFLTFVNIYVSISYISDNLSMDFDGSAFVSARILIRTVIYLIILPLLFKYMRPHFRMLVETLDKEWRVAVLVPFMFLIMQITVLYYPEPYWYWESGDWSRYISVTMYMLFGAVYYLLFFQANAIVEKYKLEKRQLLMAQQEKLWESELIRQKATSELAFQQKHDLRHHNSVIMGLLKCGDVDSLKNYLTSIDAFLESHFSNMFCLNPIVNSIINLYAGRAEEENIKTEFDVSVPDGIGIDHIDLTCVLGNTLENALEGCLRLPEEIEKKISVTMKYVDHRLRVRVENTCRRDILFDDELPVTQKPGGGTGTKSILYTAERYDGTAGFSVIEGKFITQIVLNAR